MSCEIVSIHEAADRLDEFLDRFQQDPYAPPIMIGDNGRPQAVLVSISLYETMTAAMSVTELPDPGDS